MIKRFFRRLSWYARELWWDTKEDIMGWRQRNVPRPKLKPIPFPEMVRILDDAWTPEILRQLETPSPFEQFINAQREVNEARARVIKFEPQGQEEAIP